MFLYAISSPCYRADGIYKLGRTHDPPGRLNTLLTGCAPSRTPSHDLDFEAVWLTTATNDRELDRYERILHSRFALYRMMHKIPNDCEWFDFYNNTRAVAHPIDEIDQFLAAQTWVKQRLSRAEITSIIPIIRANRFMKKQIPINECFIEDDNARICKLIVMQEPHIITICEFIGDTSRHAGCVIYPCGGGKTVMLCKAIHRTNCHNIIICCPSEQTQRQWRDTLCEYEAFAPSDITLIGTAGTTSEACIIEVMKRHVYAIITTYQSSHLLSAILEEAPNSNKLLVILDEAHHVAGQVAIDDARNGIGITRVFMRKVCDCGIKRVSLTFTPRILRAIPTNASRSYLTMDDHATFGPNIVNVQLRELINCGILPDYTIWTMCDDAFAASGIIGKAECLLEAWRANEAIKKIENNVEIYYPKTIFNHLIVFAQSHADIEQYCAFFRRECADAKVISVQNGDNVADAIQEFTKANRAIFVNCYMLGEGIDIPCADAVAIMYPKHARGQITQMFLRAGRACTNKSRFHILLPIVGQDDMSGFQEVLEALAEHDSQLRDEITCRPTIFDLNSCAAASLASATLDDRMQTLHINIETYGSQEVARFRETISTIRANITHRFGRVYVLDICAKNKIDTSIEYKNIRANMTELPENPREYNETWYNFLHIGDPKQHISLEYFITQFIIPNSLTVSSKYDKWRIDNGYINLPTIQHIIDGYFGVDNNNFDTIVQPITAPRRHRI